MEARYDFGILDPGPEFELQGKQSKKRNNNNALVVSIKYNIITFSTVHEIIRL